MGSGWPVRVVVLASWWGTVGCLAITRPSVPSDDDVASDTSQPDGTDDSGGPVDTADTGDTGVANVAPEVTVPVVAPSEVHNDTSLVCSATGSDADGPDPTVTFAWRNETRAQPLGEGPGRTLDPGIASPGDQISCTATADDGEATDVEVTTVEVGNRAPTALDVLVQPDAPVVGTTVTCSAGASDPDGGTPTVTYAWRNETTSTELGAGANLLLDGAEVAGGDVIRCTATASDGDLTGVAYDEVSATPANRAPEVDTPLITPFPAYNTHELSCTAGASDPDGTTPTVTYAWRNETRGTALGSGASFQLTPDLASPGEYVRCIVTASDGDLSDSDWTEVQLLDRPPVVGAVVISPSSINRPTATDTVACTAETSDPDGQELVVTTEWRNLTASTTLPSGTDLELSPSLVAPGDRLRCTITAAAGGLETSRTADTSVNVPPVLGTPSVTPRPAYNDTSLTCDASASDPDAGSALPVDYAWTNKTATASLGTGAVLHLTRTVASPGDEIVCEASATDGAESVQTTERVTLADRPPEVGTPRITPALPRIGQTLTCTVSASDPDGQSTTVAFAWRNDTADTPLGTGPTLQLDAADVAVADVVACEVTATAGGLSTPSRATLTVQDQPDAGDTLEHEVFDTVRYVPTGSFTMGCVLGRDDVYEDCLSDEEPTRTVTLSMPFWMMESELTQQMWADLGFSENPSAFSPGGGGGITNMGGPDHPVEFVNWWEAVAAANAASAEDGLAACYQLTGCDSADVGTGRVCTGVTVTSDSGHPKDCEGWRLPTEAEFEYASRAGTQLPFSGGDDPDDVGWYAGNNGYPFEVSYGTKEACDAAIPRNAWGICDLSGNVYEWVWDWRQSGYSGLATLDPAGPTSGSRKIMRGGHWNTPGDDLRCANRGREPADNRRDVLGFRLVRSDLLGSEAP